MRLTSASLIALTAALAAQPAFAQDAPADPAPATEDTSATDDTIVIIAERLYGQVETPQPPILELDTEDIAAYGASSIADLLDALGPQVSSSRGRGDGGRPVILVNGQRISSFRELRSYPPEAIEKVEVFPEETAQRYGYPPDQRVVNFILKDNFSSKEIELEYGQPWAGGYSTQQVEGTYLRIDGPSRLNLNLEWDNQSLLTEAERDIIQSTEPVLAGDPDPAAYRSLASDSSNVEATANWTTSIGDSGDSLSANATYERSNSLSYQGLDTVTLTDPDGLSVFRSFNAANPLSVDAKSDSYSVGAGLNTGIGDWKIEATLDGNHTDSRSIISRNADTQVLVDAAAAGTLDITGALPDIDAGVYEALTRTDTATALLTARGSPFYLPAGDVNVTLKSGLRWNRIQSEDTRNSGVETSLSRRRVEGGVNVGVPLTSTRDDVLAALGDISLNLDAGVENLSDFGTLWNWSTGLNWGLTDKLNFSATYLYNEDAPSLTQLGAAEIETPNVSYYDFSTNQTVLANVITGGNPDLPAQTQRDWKVGFSWELPFLERSRFQVDYIRNHSENVASGFPVLTPDIEAAFPDRVTRVDGVLVQVDERPVTFAQQDLERLQFGLNLSGQIGKDPGENSGRGGGEGSRGGPATIAGDGRQRSGPPDEATRARLAAMREKLCGEDGAQFAQNLVDAEENGTLADMNLPERMLERLRGEDGKIDPAKVAELRERFCSADGPRGPGGEGGQRAQGGPGGGGGGGFRGFGRGGPGGGNTGRWFFNLDYKLDLKSTVLVSEGGPTLDLLGGDALSGGGSPRHSISARGGAFYKGFGTFISANYNGAATLLGSGLPGSTDLYFGDYATFDIRTFVDLGQQQRLVDAHPFLKNTRISFDVENIFEARQRVTDSDGDVPLRYQPFRLDPTGRSFEIEFRKLF